MRYTAHMPSAHLGMTDSYRRKRARAKRAADRDRGLGQLAQTAAPIIGAIGGAAIGGIAGGPAGAATGLGIGTGLGTSVGALGGLAANASADQKTSAFDEAEARRKAELDAINAYLGQYA